MNIEHKLLFDRVTNHIIDINSGLEFDKAWVEGYICGVLSMVDQPYYELENALFDWVQDMTTRHND